MQTVELYLGRYDQTATLFRVISIEFGIEPKISSIEEFAHFLQDNAGHFVNIRGQDKLYGDAAESFNQVLQLFEQLRSERGKSYLDYAFIPSQKVILDFRKCSHVLDAYEEMRTQMEWEDWYGNNLDALWDILTGLPCKGDDFLILRLKKYCSNPNNYDQKLTIDIDKVCNQFLEAQEEYGDIHVDILFDSLEK